MKKSECGANPLLESLQLKSPELQECKTSVNGSSQAERKIQPVNKTAYNKTNIERDETEK